MDGVSTDQLVADARPAAPLRTGALRSLHHPGFGWLWTAGLMFGFGNWMQRLTVGWLVLDQTGSVFLTALSFAVRSAPNLIFGPIGGTVADRYSRRNILIAAAVAKVALALGLWLLALPGDVMVWAVLALVALAGVTAAFEMPSTQALAVDLVGPSDAANGIAVLSIATRMVGAAGALTGGLLIESLGPGPVFFFGAIAFAAGGLAIVPVRVDRPTAVFRQTGGVLRGTLDGIKSLLGIPIVATLLFFAMAVEVLGFTFQSVMPSVAEDVLGVGAAGLGTLTAMASVGGLLGSLVITALSGLRHKGALTIGITLLYGVGLVLLGNSGLFPLSLVIVTGVGIMAASFDALQWTLLQANVPDEMRGRAVGGWIFAIGFGWAGSLELGLIAEVYSVGWALSVNGIGLLILGTVATVFAGRLRRA